MEPQTWKSPPHSGSDVRLSHCPVVRIGNPLTVFFFFFFFSSAKGGGRGQVSIGGAILPSRGIVFRLSATLRRPRLGGRGTGERGQGLGWVSPEVRTSAKRWPGQGMRRDSGDGCRWGRRPAPVHGLWVSGGQGSPRWWPPCLGGTALKEPRLGPVGLGLPAPPPLEPADVWPTWALCPGSPSWPRCSPFDGNPPHPRAVWAPGFRRYSLLGARGPEPGTR